MSSSYLIFDFAGKEDAAQQAWHRLEGFRRGFRLGNKLTFVFDREEGAEAKSKDAKAALRIIVGVDFSDHEKLSRQRWLDRLRAEEPFKAASPQLVQPGDKSYDATSEKFTSLALSGVEKTPRK